MKSKLFVTCLAVLGLSIIDAQTAQAVDYVWIGTTDNNWTTTSNWVRNDGTYPDDNGDTATIPKTGTQPQLNVDLIGSGGPPEAIAALYIQAGAELTLNSTYEMDILNANGLRIDGNSVDGPGKIIFSTDSELDLQGGGLFVNDGEISVALDAAGSTDTFLQFSGTNSELAGHGKVASFDDSFEIKVNSGDTLTLKPGARIEGMLLMKDSGTFINNGVVEANIASGVLELQDLTLKNGSGKYVVNHDTGTLRFGHTAASPTLTATAMSSGFHVLKGTLDINADVMSSGHLHFVRDKIEVADGRVFMAN